MDSVRSVRVSRCIVCKNIIQVSILDSFTEFCLMFVGGRDGEGTSGQRAGAQADPGSVHQGHGGVQGHREEAEVTHRQIQVS